MRIRAGRGWIIAATLLALFALGIALTVEGRRRLALYWYDVGADYGYTFSGATVVPVEISCESTSTATCRASGTSPGSRSTVVGVPEASGSSSSGAHGECAI
jgi:hypothetical protein